MSLLSCILAAAVGAGGICGGPAAADEPPSSAAYRRIADEIDANLSSQVLAKWFPAAVDESRGGFHQNYREDWSRDPANDRSIVYQARLTWVASEAALHSHSPSAKLKLQDYALHGLKFLRERLWDPEQGGFYWGLDENGVPERNGEKHAYGIAFGIYAACACFRATGDPSALHLGRRAYAWLDAHAHDRRNGGYYEALTRDGTPILTTPGGSDSDFIGTHYGYKSMNSHIHLLEALTALHEVAPDAAIKARLNETFLLVRDRVAVAPGCLNLFFTPDWRPVPDHDSFGHDVETAFLLIEASSALGKPDDLRTWTIARQLVDHALQYGWDAENGGFFDSGTAFGPPLVTDKVWWTQAEGLNALTLMHARLGRETTRYWQALNSQWEFIKRYQVDAKLGGWYAEVRKDGSPISGRAKSDRWTEAYHQSRALMLVSAKLRELARHDTRMSRTTSP